MPKVINFDHFYYVTSEAWRALMAIEMGMKNHEVVPPQLVQRISRSKRSGSSFINLIKDQLISVRLVAYESDSEKAVSGYRLTNLGYDYLALNQLIKSGVLSRLGRMIGTGKESDVYLGQSGDAPDNELPFGHLLVVKFHRLGRTSFRKVREKRDYHQHRRTCSWLYLNRLAAQREFDMMTALHANLPSGSVPTPLGHNRGTIVMSYIANSVPLYRVLPSQLRDCDAALARLLFTQAQSLLLSITRGGLIHGDLNEFNLLAVFPASDDADRLKSLDLDDDLEAADLKQQESLKEAKLVMIDFPQVVSRDHPQAEGFYQRDVTGVVGFFRKFFNIEDQDLPPLSLSLIERTSSIDLEVKAPGCLVKSKKSTVNCTDEVLLGASSRLHIAPSSSDDDDEDEEEDDSDDASATSDRTSESEASASEQEEEEVQRQAVKSRSKVVPASSSNGLGVLNESEIRHRHRQDRRRRDQAAFQTNIERHFRVKAKAKGRANIKGQLDTFD